MPDRQPTLKKDINKWRCSQIWNNTVNRTKDQNGRPIYVRRKSFELESVA